MDREPMSRNKVGIGGGAIYVKLRQNEEAILALSPCFGKITGDPPPGSWARLFRRGRIPDLNGKSNDLPELYGFEPLENFVDHGRGGNIQRSGDLLNLCSVFLRELVPGRGKIHCHYQEEEKLPRLRGGGSGVGFFGGAFGRPLGSLTAMACSSATSLSFSLSLSKSGPRIVMAAMFKA